MRSKKGSVSVVQNVMMALIFIGVSGLIVSILITILGTMGTQFRSLNSMVGNQTAGAFENTTTALAAFPNNWLSLMVLGICAGALITIVVVGILGIFNRQKQ